MRNFACQKANKLTPDVRAAVESLLGRPLENDEAVTLSTRKPHPAPTGSAKKRAAGQLKKQLDLMSERAQAASADELEDALDEAMRHVRPSYRSIRE